MLPAARDILLATICGLAILCGQSALAAETVPNEVGGFALGSDISAYPEAMNTNFLKEMVVTDWHGFRRGTISYGVCKYPDKIVRIELKYQDQSKEYFQKLLSEYKQRFGPPDEWKGDSFGILYLWKWYFKDSEGRTISLSLQHNLRNTNETIGNAVKLTSTDMLNEERECFNRMCEMQRSDQDRKRRKQVKKPDWNYLIPR
ncbi:MAG: hypothetical protein ACK5PS_17465 [Desulfopila sp.]